LVEREKEGKERPERNLGGSETERREGKRKGKGR
jgi:hypothetical protein